MAKQGKGSKPEANGAASEHELVAMARGLAEIVAAHGLSELIVDTKETTLTVRRGPVGMPMPMPQMAMPRQFRDLAGYFRRLYNEEGGLRYPQIPADTSRQRAHVNALDRASFRRHVESVLRGRRLHPHIATAFGHYCWSSFGASFSEVGAAAGMNFFAAEFGEILVTPGGNAAIAERLHERLGRQLPEGHLRAGALVANVRAVPDGFEVAYEDAAGTLRCLHARAVVMACPKFVAARLIEDLEPERVDAIRRLRYRSYLVANVLLERRLAHSPSEVLS